MVAHKRRNGTLLTSYSCNTLGQHGDACNKYLTDCAGGDVGSVGIVCHCKCHPDDGCREKPTVRGRRKQQAYTNLEDMGY